MDDKLESITYYRIHANTDSNIESGLHSGITAAPALFINGVQYSVGVARRRHRWNIEQLMAAIVTANH
ncbi:MAG: hypothetical protein V7K35_07805 [Nostoc sp.]|uniref:hypothetical protein n=1 Tax=Nostoc sp. TaxID=1180 RepID=UPI002FF5170E